jgi:hypothetical protein
MATTSRKAIALVVSVAVAALVLAVCVLVVRAIDYRNSDFFSFWLAGRLTVNGVSPYDASAWIEGHHEAGATWISDRTFLYPLPLACLLAPIALLPVDYAFAFWLFLSTVFVVGSIAIATRPAGGDLLRVLLPLLAGAFLFRPTILSYLNGQLAPLILAVLATVLLFLREKRWMPAGILLSALLLKPNIGIPMLVLFALWLLLTANWRALGGIVTGCVLFLLIGWLSDPSWIDSYIGIGASKLAATIGYAPTLWGVLAVVLGEHSARFLPAAVLASAFVLVLILGYLSVIRRSGEPDLPTATIIAAGLLVTPYLWTYDLVLLILPLAILFTRACRSSVSYLVLAILPVGMAVASLLLVVIAQTLQRDVWSALLTSATLLISLGVGLTEGRAQHLAAQQIAESPPAGPTDSPFAH